MNVLKKNFFGKVLCFSPNPDIERKKFGLGDSFFSRVVKTIPLVRKIFLWKDFYPKKKIFLCPFRRFSERFPVVCRKFFGGFVKTEFYWSTGTFWSKTFFQVSLHFGTRRKKIQTLWQKISAGLSKKHSTFYVSIVTFWWKHFSEKSLHLLIDLGPWAKIFGGLLRLYPVVVKKEFFVSIGLIWTWKKSSLKEISFSAILRTLIGTLLGFLTRTLK